MKVKAIGPGQYIVMRDAGDVFDIPDDLFSKVWMEKVVEPVVPETQEEKDKREWLENEKKAADAAKGE